VTGNNAERLWQRGSTRRAIIEAARLLCARTGSLEFSLNTVAKEAGFSTTTVFAYFSNKQDLVSAVIADDLASMARQMRETYSFAPHAEEQVASEEPAVPEDTTTEAPTVPSTEAAELLPASREPAPASLEEASIIPFAAPSDAKPDAPVTPRPPRIDAWLERRLRVFEKSLADIETRLTTVQAESGRASALVEENTKIFGARLDASEKRFNDLSGDLTTRMSAAEKRLRDSQGELRTNLLNASMRLDQLEAAARAIASQNGYAPPAEIAPVATVTEPEPDKPLTAAADTYLSAARRAAQTAAALAEIEQAEKKAKYPHWMTRSNFAIAGLVFACFVVGAGVSYAVGQKVGSSTPVRIVVPAGYLQHRAKPAKSAAVATPLDKLSALASAGNPRAQLLIGLRYLKGEGGAPIDKREAAKWILKSAAAHDPVAQYWTGELFARGDGVSPDASEALRWYEAAAGQGNRQAMHDLGIAYAEGMGTQRDFDESARWFMKAAALGLTNSQFNLAVLYERGEGVKADLAQAYKWYAIAAANGDSESQARRDAIATQLGTDALARAKDQAASFKPETLDPGANAITLPGA
jgi:TPR repeat protein